MAFRGNIRGPILNLGTFTCVTPGTSIALNSNLSPTGASDATGSSAYDYAIALANLIISAPRTNQGGVLLVFKKGGGAYTAAEHILLYIPSGSPPWSLSQLVGPDVFGLEQLSVDFEFANDACYAFGVV